MIGKRVVVTGVAAVTPLGNDVWTSWNNLVAGVCGIGPVTKFDASDHQSRIAGEVKGFSPEPHIPPKQVRRMELFTQYAVACSKMLLENAQWEIPEEERGRTGAIVGCGLGGLEGIEYYHDKLIKEGPKRISPFFIPVIIGNMAAGQVAIFTGAMGPNLATTSACASGMHGVGYAYSEIKLGRADAMICGGTESVVTPLCFAGFNALKALSTRNEEPEKASRPFDRDRDGFVVGEGCGLLLLESLEHALARGAKILAEVVGFGASGDAHHMTAPEESGAGMALAMLAAIREAEIAPGEVDCINAHGTSTHLNDLTETRAIKRVFGEHAYRLAISGNKSQIGHLLGAAGGVECVFSALTISEGVIPGTINLENPDPECDLDYVSDGSRKQEARFVLSNSFGFGGANACVLFKRFAG
jgi:3-oxoacyl-[acyl-carrier-protein] synthase II